MPIDEHSGKNVGRAMHMAARCGHCQKMHELLDSLGDMDPMEKHLRTATSCEGLISPVPCAAAGMFLPLRTWRWSGWTRKGTITCTHSSLGSESNISPGSAVAMQSTCGSKRNIFSTDPFGRRTEEDEVDAKLGVCLRLMENGFILADKNDDGQTPLDLAVGEMKKRLPSEFFLNFGQCARRLLDVNSTLCCADLEKEAQTSKRSRGTPSSMS
eukprot:3512266-Rhodomonas_salina.1